MERSLQATGGLYHPLVLLVGASGSGKTVALQAFAKALGTSVLNVNLELSGELLGLTPEQRSLRVLEALDQITGRVERAGRTGSPVVLDNLEILFDRGLRQDPLRLLGHISRNRAVVASWNGSVNAAGRLLYAETGHAEYRNYDSVDGLIVEMDGRATVDALKDKRKAEQP